MWPPLIFFALISIVLFQFWWQDRRLRQQRSKAREEFTAASLREQQEANARARAQQEALFNSMLEGVLVLDAEWKIQIINQSLCRLFDFGAEIRGQTIVEAFRLPELSAVAERLRRENHVVDVEIILPGLQSRCLQVNASVILERDGGRAGAIFVFHDLTRIRELEKTRKEFVANVSHELRTPLSMIKGFTETLLNGAKDDPEVAARFLQKIDKHADRLFYLIEDLLTISKLESGQIALNRQWINLAELVQRVIEELASRAQGKNINLSFNIPTETKVWADGDRLQQVLSNLIENAIKYGKEGGYVRIGIVATHEAKCQVFVEDNGCGIPSDLVDRIFERFYRVDRARSRETGGTGLGLAIVKHIIHAHGGEVSVKSELGQGTAFYFWIPQPDSESKNS